MTTKVCITPWSLADVPVGSNLAPKWFVLEKTKYMREHVQTCTNGRADDRNGVHAHTVIYDSIVSLIRHKKILCVSYLTLLTIDIFISGHT